MKTTLLIASVIFGLAGSAFASDKDAKDAKGTKASTETATKEKAITKEKVAPKKQEILLTGSNIKREIRADGQVNDAPNSLTVIDRKAIERTGAADLRQVLARQSGIR
jgi:outer membrane cobalamin receptor